MKLCSRFLETRGTREVFDFWGEKGYSLIEISLVLALIAVLGGGVFLLYNNRVAPATWSSSQYNTFNSVLAALNTCKNDRGGTYPAAASAGSITAAGTTTTSGALSPYVGSNSTDISTWTYQCVSGGTSAINRHCRQRHA